MYPKLKEAIERFLQWNNIVYGSGCMGGWGGRPPEFQKDIDAGILLAKAYQDDLKAREENIQPVKIFDGPYHITTDGVSEWRVHGPGIDPKTKGWLFRSHGMALDCACAGNMGFYFGKGLENEKSSS